MATPIVNFGLVQVSGGYSAGATSVTLMAGNGSKLPDTTGGYTYPMTWWNATDYAHPSFDPNVEIVLVTARSTDTLTTIVRAQEGTVASSKNTAGKTYYMSLGITKAMFESLRIPKETHYGLQLQTHRDADVAPYQVELVGVDAIIMNDGTELRNDAGEWTGTLADISINGANGLDTGSEEVSTLYEIHAIAKEDGTRGLILHKSKIWATDTNYPTGDDATQPIRSAADNSDNKVSQGIYLSTAGTVPYIEVRLVRVGTPTGKIWFTIQNNAAGVPGSTVLATSQAYDISRLPTSEITIRIPMKSSSALSAATFYHLVAQGDWTVSTSNYVGWRYDGSSPSYTGGAMATYDSDSSGTWTSNSGRDAIFAIGLEYNNTVVTMPNGYTKRCFLGWVFNDGSGNFIPFKQVGRSNRVANIVVAQKFWSPSGSPELVSLTNLLPPRQLIKAIIGLSGTGSGGALVAIGDLRATDISYSGNTVGAQIVMGTAITAQVPSISSDVLVEANGIMEQGTTSCGLWLTGYEWE